MAGTIVGSIVVLPTTWSLWRRVPRWAQRIQFRLRQAHPLMTVSRGTVVRSNYAVGGSGDKATANGDHGSESAGGGWNGNDKNASSQSAKRFWRI